MVDKIHKIDLGHVTTVTPEGKPKHTEKAKVAHKTTHIDIDGRHDGTDRVVGHERPAGPRDDAADFAHKGPDKKMTHTHASAGDRLPTGTGEPTGSGVKLSPKKEKQLAAAQQDLVATSKNRDSLAANLQWAQGNAQAATASLTAAKAAAAAAPQDAAKAAAVVAAETNLKKTQGYVKNSEKWLQEANGSVQNYTNLIGSLSSGGISDSLFLSRLLQEDEARNESERQQDANPIHQSFRKTELEQDLREDLKQNRN